MQFVYQHWELLAALLTMLVGVVGYSFTVGRKVSEMEDLKDESKDLQSQKALETRAMVEQQDKRLSLMERRMDRYEDHIDELKDDLAKINTKLEVVVAWVADQKALGGHGSN